MVLFSFVTCLLLFLAIGLASMRHARCNHADYLVASRGVAPWLVALSAVATNNSGYMFIGLIGYTYVTGLASVWMMAGWIAGDLLASLLVHRQLRVVAGRYDLSTYGGLLSRWHGGEMPNLRRLTGAITLVFLGTYAAAQLSAGGKALQALFGWEHYSGALLGAVIVLGYSAAGGIRASIWTDAAQSLVMITAMGLMLWVGLDTVGGLGAFHTQLDAVDPHYLDLFPRDVDGTVGALLFVAGWAFAGYGVVGQPHIMVRFMAMGDPAQLGRVRAYYYSWFVLFWCAAIGVGLSARLLLPEVATFDAELALPTLARQLLPEVLVGLVLAGIFAATISTADSLVLSCAAALTRDFPTRRADRYWVTKLGTAAVTVAALAIALAGNRSVFELVLDSWGVLASAFAPLLTLYALGQRPSEPLAIGMVCGGAATMYGWSLFGPAQVYSVLPGITAGFLVFALGRMAGLTEAGEPAEATAD